MSISNQLSGSPLDTPIKAPLKAIVNARAESAEPPIGSNPPLLKITPIPSFTMDEVVADFSMEVKSDGVSEREPSLPGTKKI